jgi:hypothetical protein
MATVVVDGEDKDDKAGKLGRGMGAWRRALCMGRGKEREYHAGPTLLTFQTNSTKFERIQT